MPDNAPNKTASMTLPKNAMEDWTKIMQGDAKVPDELNTGDAIVMARATYEDGTWVVGGVMKSDTPSEYNTIFFWVFDKDDRQYPGWPIDVSDFEDFRTKQFEFNLNDNEQITYVLNMVEG